MGFFAENQIATRPKGKAGQPSTKFLHEHGCHICPLNREPLNSPKMVPTGSADPDIFILGGAPGRREDENGIQFTGPAGDLLRPLVPRDWRDRLMWDNVLQCRTPKDRTPAGIEIECCRPRHVKAIEAAKPTAIFGFGGVPLSWVIGNGAIANWRGRRIPVRIGSHVCWYFSFDHPDDLIEQRNERQRESAENERIFKLDLERAFRTLPKLPFADCHTKEWALANIESITECTHEDALFVAGFLEMAAQEAVTGVDIEAPCLRPYAKEACIYTVAVATGARTVAFPIDHPEAKWSAEDLQIVVDALLTFLKAEKVRKAVHNLAYELEWFGVLHGLELLRGSRWDDTMSQAFVLDQRVGRKASDDDDGVLECFGLGFLTQLHFGIDIKKLSPHINRKRMSGVPLRDMLPYNGLDAKYHLFLCIAQDRELRAQGLTEVYESHLRRISTCVITQAMGVPLDPDVPKQLGHEYDFELLRLDKELDRQPIVQQFREQTGGQFNPASSADMVVICRDILKRPEGKRGKPPNERYSVDEEVLASIKHPLMPLVLGRRGVAKLRSTYVFDDLNPVVWPDGMLHPLFNSLRARTARLSSSDPNFQNIPKRDAEQKRIRKQIAALVRRLFMSLDYGQIEARCFAMVSRDAIFIKMLWDKYDVHAEWARRIALVSPARIGGRQNLTDAKVMKIFRDDVKNQWVFPLFFGAMLKSVAGYVGVDEALLKPLYDEFWRTFSGIRDWQERNQKFYNEHGYVELLTGRRRCGPLSANQVCNSAIQGLAAEIVMDGMNRISEIADATGNWDLHPIAQIHDDLMFHPLEDDIADLAQIIVAEMVRPDTFDFINVPLVAEMSVGKNWYEMVKVREFSSAEWYGREAHLGLAA